MTNDHRALHTSDHDDVQGFGGASGPGGDFPMRPGLAFSLTIPQPATANPTPLNQPVGHQGSTLGLATG